MTTSEQALPTGFTRGCLAGLDAEERKRAVEAFTAQATVTSVEAAVQALAAQAIRHEPVSSYATIIGERDVNELRAMAADYRISNASRLGHDDLVTLIVAAAQADQRDCELAFECCSEEQYASLREVVAAGGRIEFDVEEAPQYAHLRAFPPYTFLYIHEDRFTFLVCDAFLANLRGVDQEAVARARKVSADVVACASALVELCGIVESHTAYNLFSRWFPEDELTFDAFARRVVREAVSMRYDFVCWNNGKKDYLLHFTLEDSGEDGGEDATHLTRAEYRERLIERHETVPVYDCGRAAVEEGVLVWKQSLPEVVALRAFLDAHIPAGENEYVFADRVIGELLFSTAATLDSQRVLAYLNEKGLGPLLKADDTLVELVTELMRTLPNWDCNGHAHRGERAYTATSARKAADATGAVHKVGRNDPCPCGSGLKYKKCCGAPAR